MREFFEQARDFIARTASAIIRSPRTVAAIVGMAIGAAYEASRETPHAILVPVWGLIAMRIYELPEATRRHIRQLRNYLNQEPNAMDNAGFMLVPPQNMPDPLFMLIPPQARAQGPVILVQFQQNQAGVLNQFRIQIQREQLIQMHVHANQENIDEQVAKHYAAPAA